jgi:radical SAM superfamily enzyme YgiQ (UPF0313 family)
MKILIIDPYKKSNYRISKDTSGGYGTANNFGDSIFTYLLKRSLKSIQDWPPLFAAYAHSVLIKKGHDVEFERKITKKKYDFYIVTSSIVCYETEIQIIKQLSKKNNKIFVIGSFATNNPALYSKFCATVIIGEPEFYFLSKTSDEYLIDLKQNQVVFSHNLTLDDLPYPLWDIISKKNKIGKLFGNENAAPIIATRGCPFSCFKYCVYPLQQGRTVRQRSINSIIDELIYLKKKGYKIFIFRDPVFSINKNHTVEFINEIIKKEIKIKFVIETHLRILDPDLIMLLKKAGMIGVKVGIESPNKDILKEANRYSVSNDEQLTKINFLNENNIKVSAMYIIGFPDDTVQTINDTINYALKLDTFYAQFSVWTPYPGTPVYKEYENIITKDNFESFDQYQLVYKHKNLSELEIRKLLTKAYTKYYLRFNWIKNFFKQ